MPLAFDIGLLSTLLLDGYSAPSAASVLDTDTFCINGRATRVHYDSHGVSNLRWTNNYARTDYTNPNSESFFMQMLTHLWDADYNNSNAVFKNNVYEHNEEAAGRAPYVFRLVDRAAKGGPAWPRNSQFADNHLRGSGTVGYVYWFKDGNDPTGKSFSHNNSNSLKATKGTYRMN